VGTEKMVLLDAVFNIQTNSTEEAKSKGEAEVAQHARRETRQ